MRDGGRSETRPPCPAIRTGERSWATHLSNAWPGGRSDGRPLGAPLRSWPPGSPGSPRSQHCSAATSLGRYRRTSASSPRRRARRFRLPRSRRQPPRSRRRPAGNRGHRQVGVRTPGSPSDGGAGARTATERARRGSPATGIGARAVIGVTSRRRLHLPRSPPRTRRQPIPTSRRRTRASSPSSASGLRGLGIASSGCRPSARRPSHLGPAR